MSAGGWPRCLSLFFFFTARARETAWQPRRWGVRLGVVWASKENAAPKRAAEIET